MAAKQIVDGLNLSTKIVMPSQPCLGCMTGKMEIFSNWKNASNTNWTTHSLQLMRTHSILKHQVVPNSLFYTDDFSGYRTVFFLKQNSDVSDCFKEFVNILYTETGQLVHTLRADNGGEFTGQAFRSWSVRKSKQDHRGRCPMSTRRQASSSLSLG
jgi:hypothetical protein